ncbi:MAG: Rieske 2Fe-2S domain-containing protein [bacterium]
MTGNGWHAALPLTDVPNGRPHEATIAGVSVLIIRQGNDVYATTLHCPHKFGNLAEGTLAGRLLTCPQHTATFDLATGRPRPGEEWAGNLTTYACRVREGLVEVQLPALA